MHRNRYTRNVAGLLLLFLVAVPSYGQQSLLDYAAPNVKGSRTSNATNGLVVLDQQPNASNGLFSDDDCGICGTGRQFMADDFTLADTETIIELVMWGGYFPANIPNVTDDFNVLFWTNVAGLPGSVIASESGVSSTRQQTGVILFGVNEYIYTLDINDVTLGPGSYFVEIVNNTFGNPDQFFWELGDPDPPASGPVFAFANDPFPGSNWADSGTIDGAMQIIVQDIVDAELSLDKDAQDNGDGTGVYTVTVFNDGPLDATGVLVQEYLPGFLTVTAWDATHGVFDVFTGQWDLGDLDNQETAELVIYVRFDAQGEYCNSAAIVASDQNDPNGGNNDDEACTFRPTPRQDPDFVSGQGPGGIINRGGGRFAADMSVTKTAGSASAAAGDVIDWTITVANNGPNSTSGVEVTDTLPACLTVTGTVASQGTVSGTVWSVGAVRVGGSATLVVSTEVGTNCGTEITNVVDITGSNLPDPTDLFNRFDVPPVDNNKAEASVAVTSGAAAKAQLGTNYPNPFNPATVVPFEVRQAGEVTLQVYDLLGRLVETLVSERLTAGAYEAEFRATSLPTGVYLVRLEASGEVHTQRITLMK